MTGKTCLFLMELFILSFLNRAAKMGFSAVVPEVLMKGISIM